MLTGSGLVPADFFTAGSSLSKAVIGCELALPSCCASGHALLLLRVVATGAAWCFAVSSSLH